MRSARLMTDDSAFKRWNRDGRVALENLFPDKLEKVREWDLTVEIEDLNHLRKIIEAVRKVGGVRSVERIMDASRDGKK